MAAFLFSLTFFGAYDVLAQTPASGSGVPVKKVLMVFGDARDLPGNMMMEQAVREKILAHSTNQVEFFTESLDAIRFPGTKHTQEFKGYLTEKYTGQNLDAVIAFMSRDFSLIDDLPSSLVSNVPVIFVAVSELDIPETVKHGPFSGVVQRFDIEGTIKFIFQLQPQTRRIIVVGGISKTDQIILDRINQAAESIEGVRFEFWTNRPITEIVKAASSLPPDTVVLLSQVQRDITGREFYTTRVAQMLAPSADVPVYVMGAGLIGSGALGGSVVDNEFLGTRSAELVLSAFGKQPGGYAFIETRTNGTPMVDWRELKRWNIPESQLPPECVVRYRPHSVWEQYQVLILLTGTALLAQAVTIAALLVQRGLRRRAEAQIQQQRTELAHVARVSTMGQLASALTHELNQPLGAILRNAEAAEIFLQKEPLNMEEIRAILADIRRDDRRAGDVIDRMRTLFKRQGLTPNRLDLRNLVLDTIALARPDAEARQIQITTQMSPQLPAVYGDRVHLQQVLLNLILNGMDAMSSTPKLERRLTIRVLEADEGILVVAVMDCGTGIAPENINRIFEPFFSTKPDGMGMGLPISKTIIQAHGGDIHAANNVSSGATFVFTLPSMDRQKPKNADLSATP